MTYQESDSSQSDSVSQTDTAAAALFTDAPAPAPARIHAPDLFDEFWAAYPRRTGKAAARKAWAKAVREASPAQIVAGARTFAADPNLPTGNDAGFVPHPSTWLNEGRWDDDPLPPRHRPMSRQEVEQQGRDDWYQRSLARAAAYDAQQGTQEPR